MLCHMSYPGLTPRPLAPVFGNAYMSCLGLALRSCYTWGSLLRDMTMPKKLLGCALLLGAVSLATPAWSQIYRCVDADGKVTYSNVGNNKGCKRMQLDAPNSMAAPARTTGRTPGAAANPTPVDFPRVTGEAQKARDNDRRAILEQELASEQKALEQAKKELAEQEAVRHGDEKNYQKVLDRLQPYKDRVAQHERNIQAINRELANLK